VRALDPGGDGAVVPVRVEGGGDAIGFIKSNAKS